METSGLTQDLIVSQMAENLVGSEIIKLAGEVKALIARGEDIVNLTIGDFDPAIFPIPDTLKESIQNAYSENHTNYPAANGIAELRESVSNYIGKYDGFQSYSADDYLIAGGARPLIYAAYQTIVDREDVVVFPVPSWNNNHYTHLAHGKPVFVQTTPEHKFMPTADSLRPYISDAVLISVCSPLNPTGTTFTKEGLEAICDLILEENAKRQGRKPVYLLYDQIYWMLMRNMEHYHPVGLRPEMSQYTIYIDGISKSLAATGVRVGWAFGPQKLIGKMKSILGHVGAWAPKAEQVATANTLGYHMAIETFLKTFLERIEFRLNGFHRVFQTLKSEGMPVDSIEPEAAIYLTVKIDLTGKTTPSGNKIASVEEATRYILEQAKLAIVPFYAFGAPKDSCWYRLSVGTAKETDIEKVEYNLRNALSRLK